LKLFDNILTLLIKKNHQRKEEKKFISAHVWLYYDDFFTPL
jgi:hypothetical protein